MVGKRLIGIFLVSLFLLVLITESGADTLYLKNGRSIAGLIKSEDDDRVELEISFGTVSFSKDEIGNIERSSPEAAGEIQRRWEEERKQAQEKISQWRRQEEERPARVEFSQDSQAIILPVFLNGRVKVSLILDTGSTLVVLRRSIANKLGINLSRAAADIQLTLADGRKADAKKIVLQSVKVHGVEARNVEAAIILDEKNSAGLDDGLLGMSFLQNFNFSVDHKEKRLTLEKLR